MTGEEAKISIFLTEFEAERFAIFQKNFANIQILIESGALAVKNGRSILNFDSNGILQDVSIDSKAWKRGKIK